ncbi:hypothetical protein E0H26_22990 [Micromonospora zingiberis]|uniref:DUF4232 domain-containing protein n=1 Tax=Micromonospora zingiberis TaxID=2053011 RepID=A0A4R0G8Y1_9ACTN|nr:hypothetical protein [Micromonospora zingiberis]TCB93410.1 hypothetical protein E0H26_22990 [Micromonospora zingiberis]
MGRSRRLTSCLLVMAALLAGCTDDSEAGRGFLEVAALRDPLMPGHFTAEPVLLSGQLTLRPNGCVNVVLDGVERVPLWPTGSNVAPDPDNLNGYVVTLPGGTTLAVDSTSGDHFAAQGIIDDHPGPYEVEPGLPTQVGLLVDYCGAEARPVAFPDATSFTVG